MSENYTPLIQRLLTALGNPLINNSYIWSLDNLVPSDFTGNILQFIIDTNGWESNSANDWQTIAIGLGITEPSNGSWLQAIVELYEG
jgi:hypothetical protein